MSDQDDNVQIAHDYEAIILRLTVEREALRAENDRLKAVIPSLRRDHSTCDDCWYTCPLAIGSDGESDCCNSQAVSLGVCTCGAARHNAIIEQALSPTSEAPIA